MTHHIASRVYQRRQLPNCRLPRRKLGRSRHLPQNLPSSEDELHSESLQWVHWDAVLDLLAISAISLPSVESFHAVTGQRRTSTLHGLLYRTLFVDAGKIHIVRFGGRTSVVRNWVLFCSFRLQTLTLRSWQRLHARAIAGAIRAGSVSTISSVIFICRQIFLFQMSQRNWDVDDLVTLCFELMMDCWGERMLVDAKRWGCRKLLRNIHLLHLTASDSRNRTAIHESRHSIHVNISGIENRVRWENWTYK